MDKLINKLAHKTASKVSGAVPTATCEDWQDAACDAPPTLHQMYTYRKQRGVNLGSLFTLETWLTPSLFHDVRDAKSEFDLCSKLDANTAKQRLEQHWRRFVDAGDWQWMRNNGVNTVRLPVSYYHFLSGHPDANVRALMNGTEYAPYASIYQGAHAAIIATLEAAAAHHIGVLVDLHGAPGGQNGEGHCGLSNGKANFFERSGHRGKTIEILQAIAATVTRYDNIVGLELLNEPQNNHKLPGWYAEAVKALCLQYSARLPLYLGDCWSTDQYAELLSQNKDVGFLVMDHHLYRCFTPNDHSKSAHQHADEVRPANGGPSHAMLKRASDKLQGNLVIGEWSAALHHTSLDKRKPDGQQQWATAQLDAFHDQCAGFYFWTLKKEGPPDAGWCLYTAVEQGVLPSGLGAPRSNKSVDELREIGERQGQHSYGGHVNYWNAHADGKPMQHERYLEGFRQGWADALAFYAADASQIGFAGRWVEQRARANTRQRCHGDGSGEWEYVHGASEALRKFHHEIRS